MLAKVDPVKFLLSGVTLYFSPPPPSNCYLLVNSKLTVTTFLLTTRKTFSPQRNRSSSAMKLRNHDFLGNFKNTSRRLFRLLPSTASVPAKNEPHLFPNEFLKASKFQPKIDSALTDFPPPCTVWYGKISDFLRAFFLSSVMFATY